MGIRLCDYYDDWINTYKVGSVREVTLVKYRNVTKFLKNNFEPLEIGEINKRIYQNIINKYAENHHKQTVTDFHNNLKAAILDAIDEGILQGNPTRGTIIKGNPQKKRKENKFLSQAECKKLIKELNLAAPLIDEKHNVNWDWLIILCLKTGLRFSEALALTPSDFNFKSKIISVDKTFDYKFDIKITKSTKTESSKRKIKIDNNIAAEFSEITKGMRKNQPFFIPAGHRPFNSTINFRLRKLCEKAKIPVITIHGLRHTHASILLYNGVSINSISRRLGHSQVSMTQNVYMHVIKELENKDNGKITKSLLMLGG